MKYNIKKYLKLILEILIPALLIALTCYFGYYFFAGRDILDKEFQNKLLDEIKYDYLEYKLELKDYNISYTEGNDKIIASIETLDGNDIKNINVSYNKTNGTIAGKIERRGFKEEEILLNDKAPLDFNNEFIEIAIVPIKDISVIQTSWGGVPLFSLPPIKAKASLNKENSLDIRVSYFNKKYRLDNLECTYLYKNKKIDSLSLSYTIDDIKYNGSINYR